MANIFRWFVKKCTPWSNPAKTSSLSLTRSSHFRRAIPWGNEAEIFIIAISRGRSFHFRAKEIFLTIYIGKVNVKIRVKVTKWLKRSLEFLRNKRRKIQREMEKKENTEGNGKCNWLNGECLIGSRGNAGPLHYFNLLTRLRPAYLMLNRPNLAHLVFANKKACLTISWTFFYSEYPWIEYSIKEDAPFCLLSPLGGKEGLHFSYCLKKLKKLTTKYERLSSFALISIINWMWFISSWQCRYWNVYWEF